jgi:hypothetical protein
MSFIHILTAHSACLFSAIQLCRSLQFHSCVLRRVLSVVLLAAAFCDAVSCKGGTTLLLLALVPQALTQLLLRCALTLLLLLLLPIVHNSRTSDTTSVERCITQVASTC